MKCLMIFVCLGGWAVPVLAQAPVQDLAFTEFFRQPVGPRGLEPTAKLLSLAGKRVRLSGYLAQAENGSPGVALLSPQPLVLGDGDEGLADDLPASVVTVLGRMPDALPRSSRVRLTGVLELAPRLEADGRISFIRLLLEKAAMAPTP